MNGDLRKYSNIKLLLIEDDDSHAEIIRRYLLRSEGVNIHLTREINLAAGLEQLSQCHFDAILLDLRLPDSDIDETLPRAVRFALEVPIVVLSSLEDRDNAVKAVKEGAEDYLCKSDLSSELLVRTILSSMARKESETRLRQQLQRNAFLAELSQFALSESYLERIKMRCRETLINTLLVEYVEIIEQNLPLNSNKEVPTESNNLAEVDLESVGLQHLKEAIEKKKLKSGINVLLEDRQTHAVFGVIAAHTYQQRQFLTEDVDFVRAIANIITSLILRKRLQDQLHLKILDLQEAHQKKDDFLATLSHELRTPLNIMGGYVQILKDGEFSSDDFQKSMAGIEANLLIETKLIEDILDLSQIVTGKMKLNLSTFDLSEAIQQVIQSMAPAISAKQLHLNATLAPSLGSFYGDQTRIQQIIWNLLSNAVKFTPGGGTIKIYSSMDAGFFEFSIEDNGQGISPENIKYVFNRFWQEDSSISRRYMGLGLGLGLVKQIVELHGGTVSVESKGQNQGAHFSFHLPLSQNNVIAKPSQPPKPETNQLSSPLRHQKILVVDDSEDTVSLLKHLLNRAGAEVTGCLNPIEALKTAKQTDYDVIISDIGMPVLNGYELLKAYREWEKDHHSSPTPAIALTAYASEEDARKALEAGFQVHMSKPMNFKTLQWPRNSLVLRGWLRSSIPRERV